jgi:SAM-dependent methyltransferase
MKAIRPAGFEQKFRDNIDPWNYTSSAFERHKRAVLLRACGCRTYGRGLELGCAIGETTRHLARICLRLLAIDSSITALAEARRRLAGNARVTFRQLTLPEQTPLGRFDLIVASEIAYYLRPQELHQLMAKLDRALAAHGRIVFLNHLRPFDDAAQLPSLSHKRVRAKFEKTMPLVFHERHHSFDVIAFCKPLVRRGAA